MVRLCGVLPCGNHATTSRLEGKNKQNQVITFSGSVYELLDVNEEYETLFPDAKNKLLETLPIIR